MPLRDHFHSPVNDRSSWDELHGLWPSLMVLQLAKRLPKGFVAAPKIHLGGAVEIDAATFERDDVPAREENEVTGGTALAVRDEPTTRMETDLPDVDEYSVRIYDQARGRRLVAAIELVSPSNKDRPETRRAFTTKCTALLREDVCVTIVDVVTSRDFNLYAELLDSIDCSDRSVSSPPGNIYAVTARGRVRRNRWLFEAWHQPLVIGQPLPNQTIWIAEEVSVTLDLETSYEEACKVLQIE
jgi:hypothetical protein